MGVRRGEVFKEVVKNFIQGSEIIGDLGPNSLRTPLYKGQFQWPQGVY